MNNIKNFSKNHIPLLAITLGLALVGYLGYRAIRWIIHKCRKTKQIDTVAHQAFSSQTDFWQKVKNSEALQSFKNNWKELANPDERKSRALSLKKAYVAGKDQPHGAPYTAPLGKVHWIPGEFNLWMKGVALIAAYLKEKKQVEGLFVCETMESLSQKLSEIQADPKDQRCAFIVGTMSSGLKEEYPGSFEPNFPQHKVAVCVEKKNGKLSIALIDAQPGPLRGNADQVSYEHLTDEIWEGYDKQRRFNAQELVFRAILKGCASHPDVRFLRSHVIRESVYGCAAFALQDAVAFLKDPDFFSHIKCDPNEKDSIDEARYIEAITMLPATFMRSTQLSRTLESYREKGGSFNTPLPGKTRTLQEDLHAHSAGTNQNHYITKKTFKYLTMAVEAIKILGEKGVEKAIEGTLVS